MTVLGQLYHDVKASWLNFQVHYCHFIILVKYNYRTRKFFLSGILTVCTLDNYVKGSRKPYFYKNNMFSWFKATNLSRIFTKIRNDVNIVFYNNSYFSVIWVYCFTMTKALLLMEKQERPYFNENPV